MPGKLYFLTSETSFLVRVIIFFLFLLTVYLQVALWQHPGGKKDVARLESSVYKERKALVSLQDRNTKIKADVLDLKNGLEALEERARNELGMIEEGEIFFRTSDMDGDSLDATFTKKSFLRE